MRWLKVSVAVGLGLFLPLTAPAVTTQFTVPLPTIEKTTYVYDAHFVNVASDNALTESKSSGDSASLFGPLAGKLVAAKSVDKGLGANPFKGKTRQQIDEILTSRGFKKVGTDPASGKGAYFHPETGRRERRGQPLN